MRWPWPTEGFCAVAEGEACKFGDIKYINVFIFRYCYCTACTFIITQNKYIKVCIMYVCMYVCISIYVCVYIYIYIYI